MKSTSLKQPLNANVSMSCYIWHICAGQLSAVGHVMHAITETRLFRVDYSHVTYYTQRCSIHMRARLITCSVSMHLIITHNAVIS